MPDPLEPGIQETVTNIQEKAQTPISTTKDLIKEYGDIFEKIDLEPQPISWYLGNLDITAREDQWAEGY